MNSVLVRLLLIFPTLAHAAEEPPALASGIGQMMIGLGLVLALLFGALFLIKKLSLPRGPAASSLRVIGAAALGPRERVVMVAVGDKVLVLGVAQGQVNALHTFEAADFPEDSPVQDSALADGAFAGKLRQLMEKRK